MTRVPGTGCLSVGPLIFFPADAIVDDQTGCLLRPISYSGDAPAGWWELDDISTEPGDPDDFQVHVPPDDYVVHGHKVWTSYSDVADWCLLLARTDTQVSRHQGLSSFVISMRQPGIEQRPCG